jgi:hypothetical protein
MALATALLGGDSLFAQTKTDFEVALTEDGGGW